MSTAQAMTVMFAHSSINFTSLSLLKRMKLATCSLIVQVTAQQDCIAVQQPFQSPDS